MGWKNRRTHRRYLAQAVQLRVFIQRKRKYSPRNAAGQAAKKESREDQDPLAALLLCAFA